MAFEKLAFAASLILFLNCGLLTAQTPFRECANKKPLPLRVQIDDCTALPCNICKDRSSNIAVQFVATQNDMSQIRGDLRLTTLGAQIPFELTEEQSNVCKNLLYGAYCPMDAGEDATYNVELQVSEYQPEVRTKIEVNIRDRNDGTVLACFVTDANVKKSKASKQL